MTALTSETGGTAGRTWPPFVWYEAYSMRSIGVFSRNHSGGIVWPAECLIMASHKWLSYNNVNILEEIFVAIMATYSMAVSIPKKALAAIIFFSYEANGAHNILFNV
jgi:hypothetical protein